MFEVGQKIKIIDGGPMGIENHDDETMDIIDVYGSTFGNQVAILEGYSFQVVDEWIEAGYAEIVV